MIREHEQIEAYLRQLDEGTRSVLEQLLELRQEEEQDDYGLLAPSDAAFNLVWSLITETSRQIDGLFPKASVLTDSEGSIRIEWRRGPREVRLVAPDPATGPGYVYSEVGEQYSLDPALSPATLSEKLRWLEDERHHWPTTALGEPARCGASRRLPGSAGTPGPDR